jgi:hypothetical protein
MSEKPERKPGSGKTFYFASGRWAGKTFAMKIMMLRHAAESPTGRINVMRRDRETKAWVTDVITADMPIDEIIL